MSKIELYNEDCMELMKRYPDNYFELAIVDPPYGINHSEIAGKQSGKKYGNAAAAKKRVYDKRLGQANTTVRVFHGTEASI